jgi:hypothetical protein
VEKTKMEQVSKIYKALFFALVYFATTANSSAEGYQSRLGLHAGTGNVTTDLADEDPDLGIQSGIVFEHQVSPNGSIVSIYSEGDADFCLITCFSGEQRETKWKSLQVSYKKGFPMTKRWTTFVRGGLNYYQSKFTGNFVFDENQRPEIEEAGFNYVVGLGLEFEANNGFFIGFEAQRMPMDIIEANTYNIFAGFSF